MAWISTLKIVLISSGVVALALAMKLSVPLAMEFASHVPLMWTSFRSLLRPPYLYVLINGIIITIAASTRFHHDRSPHPLKLQSADSIVLEAPPPLVHEQRDQEPVVDHEVRHAMIDGSVEAVPELEIENYYHEEEDKLEVRPATINGSIEAVPEPEIEDYYHEEEDKLGLRPATINGSVEAVPEPEIEDYYHEEEDKRVVSESTWTLPKTVISSDAIALPVGKPLLSARFSHRKLARSSPEGGKPLRVAKPKRNDTLENTWKAITEGRSMPLSRHMKKSETWENHSRQFNVDSAVESLETPAVVKSETFKDRMNEQLLTAVGVSSSAGFGGKLRKEPSLSQEDLNRRVEAFINKFNEEMRLQRQESLKQYMQMVNPGSGSH